MKRFLLFVFSILLTFSFAIAQDGINYQGAATDVNGDELTNQNITIRASVLSTSANGNLEWEETHSATTDQFGLFNVVIGQGTNTTNGATATFNDMNWGSADHYLKIEMDATGGTNYAMIGTTQMMSVPYALYAKSAGIDSTMLANMIGSSGGLDSSEIAALIENAIGGSPFYNGPSGSNDFENQSPNSDFNNVNTGQIPQALDGKKVIIYSTDKNIYLTDSVGSFLSVLYSVENNIISNLTSNANGDTLYFLQSAHQSAVPNIMMTSINNINPVVIGSVPCYESTLRDFKYSNGDFYYITNGRLLKISDGNLNFISENNYYCVAVSNSGSIYTSHTIGGGTVLIDNTNYSGSGYQYIFDMYLSESENRMYIWRSVSGGEILYWDLSTNSEVVLFSPSGNFPTTSNHNEQAVSYYDSLVYFNQAKSLFSVQNDGSDLRLISSSNDEYLINSIVPLVFNYQNIPTNPNSTTINVEDYIASNKKKIFYSTDKNIYLTDSVGSFLSVLYSVENNIISNLTSNANGDTLYFLQSAHQSAVPNIMMTSINNINPVVIGSVPCYESTLRDFKYSNGDFYYITNGRLLKISDGNLNFISENNYYCVAVSNSGSIYTSHTIGGGTVLIDNTNYSGSGYQYIFDMYLSESENRMYIWRSVSGGEILYWDLSTNSEVVLFSPSGNFPTTSNHNEQAVSYYDSLVYFNQAKSLFSVQNDGSDLRLISSSNDEYLINSIVIVD